MHQINNSGKPWFDRTKSQYWEEFVDDSQPANSDIERNGESAEDKAIYELTWYKFSAPFSRGLCQLAIQFVIIQCFEFAAKSGVNGGIISTIFSSSSLFSIVIFYFKYG
jgi:hypothetical protein